LNLEEPLGRLCPYPFPEASWAQGRPEAVIGELKGVVQALSMGKDVLLIMGSEAVFFDGAYGVPETSLVQALDADLILLNRYGEHASSLYSILSVCSLLRGRVKGIILNRVPPGRFESITGQLIPLLAEKGLPMIAVVPEDPMLLCWSLREVLEILGGEVLSGEESLENPVGGMTVGSVYLEGDLLLFKRVYNKIVLLEPSTPTEEPPTRLRVAGIILTGGRRPPVELLEAVKRAGVPLIVVRSDTFETRESLERNPPSTTQRDAAKVRRFTELMDRGGAFDKLLHSLGLSRAS
jgi:BioD-like phosphotransacetylase family protein